MAFGIWTLAHSHVVPGFDVDATKASALLADLSTRDGRDRIPRLSHRTQVQAGQPETVTLSYASDGAADRFRVAARRRGARSYEQLVSDRVTGAPLRSAPCF